MKKLLISRRVSIADLTGDELSLAVRQQNEVTIGHGELG
jgi:hypothetical protein